MSPQSCLLRLHYPSVLHNLASTFQPSCAVCGGLYPIASARRLFQQSQTLVCLTATESRCALFGTASVDLMSLQKLASRDCVSSSEYSTHPSFRQSVKSRVVACYHDLPFEDMTETFPDPDPAREAISSSITTVWDAGSNHPFIKMPECIAPAKPHISHDGGTDEMMMEIHAQTRNLGRSMEA